MTTGLDLRLERVRVGATQREVGRHMGISAARVSVIERTGNQSNTGIDKDTATRYKAAIADIEQEAKDGRNPVMRFDVSGIMLDGSIAEHYRFAKNEARRVARKEPWVRTVELVVRNQTNAMTLLGYMDGFAAAGVSSRVLDASGTMLNRRIG
jgi:hypothetical protein